MNRINFYDPVTNDNNWKIRIRSEVETQDNFNY